MKQQYYFSVDTCVICGNMVPEGHHVCWDCMKVTEQEHYRIPLRPAIPAPPSLLQRFLAVFR